MNVLIVCHKSDKKNYETVIKTAPNATVLGAVSVVKSDLLENIGLRYNPHLIIYDTEVAVSKCNIIQLINAIADRYPHIPFMVFTSENDDSQYKTPYVFKKQISSIDFIDCLKKAFLDYNNTYLMKSIEGSNITEELIVNKKLDVTEKPVVNNVDKLSNVKVEENYEKEPIEVSIDDLPFKPIKPVDYRKYKKRKPILSNIKLLYIILPVAIVFIIVMLVLLKSCGNNDVSDPYIFDENPSSADMALPEEISSTENISINTETITQNNLLVPTIPVTEETTVPMTTEPTTNKNNSTSNSNVSNNVNSSNVGNNNNSSASSQNNNYNNSNSSNSNSQQVIVNSEARQPQDSNSNINVTKITLSNSSKKLYEGTSFKLTATVLPSNATNKTVYWTTNNSSVATVSGGTVTARKAGTAVITARAGNKTASCTITVSAKHEENTETDISDVYIYPSERKIAVGSKLTIELIKNPYGKCTWSISNPTVAEFDGVFTESEIVVIGKKKGVANIIATLPDGKQYKAKITVV